MANPGDESEVFMLSPCKSNTGGGIISERKCDSFFFVDNAGVKVDFFLFFEGQVFKDNFFKVCLTLNFKFHGFELIQQGCRSDIPLFVSYFIWLELDVEGRIGLWIERNRRVI